MELPAEKLRRWWRSRWTVTAGAVTLLYTLTGFLLVPALINWQMRKQLPALTHRTVVVRQVRLDPYAQDLAGLQIAGG